MKTILSTISTLLRLVLTLLLIWEQSAWAAAPSVLTYQGRLKEAGLPVQGARTVKVELCDDPAAGTCHTAVNQAVTVSSGLFHVNFSVPAAADLKTGVWYVQISVGGTALTPRELLTSSAYAVFSSTAGTVVDGAIDSAKLAAGAVGTAKLAPDAVTTSALLAGAVTDAKIVSMSASKLTGALPALDGSALTGVTATGIQDGAVDSAKLAANAVVTGKIAAQAVDTTKLSAGAVDTGKILDGAVTDAKILAMSASKLTGALPALDGSALTGVVASSIADGAVDSAKLAAGAVTTSRIAALAVDSSKLASNSVDNEKLVNGSVDSWKIAVGAVETAKILDGAITNAKLAGGSVDSWKIAPNSIQAMHLAAGAVETAKLLDGAVTDGKIISMSASKLTGPLPAISGGALTGVIASSIADGAVSNPKIADGAVDTAKLAANSVDSSKIQNGAVETAKLVDGAVTSVKLANGVVDSGKLASDANSLARVSGGLMVADTSKVGIGLSNPSEMLDVLDSAKVSGALYSNAYNALVSASHGKNLLIQAGRGGGGVGKDINFGASTLNGGDLTLAGGGGGHFSKGGDVIVAGGDVFDTGSTGGSVYLKAQGYSNFGLGHIGFYTGGSYPANLGSPIERARIDGNGNFGIGTTSPGAKLEVVGTLKIVDGSQGTGKVLVSDANGLASWQVTGLADGAVTTAKLANLAVDSSKLAANAVDSSKLVNGAVDSSKIVANSIQTAHIAALAVDSSKLAANSVDADKIAAGSVNSGKLADGSVTLAKLAADSVDSAKLSSDANSLARVTGGLMAIPSGDTGKVGLGTPNASYLLHVVKNSNTLDTTQNPTLRIENTNPTPSTGGDANIANLVLSAGNGAITGALSVIHGTAVDGSVYDNNLLLAAKIGYPIDFAPGGNRSVRFSVDGRVGLGTTSPAQKLDVNGKIRLGDDAVGAAAGTLRWSGTNFEGYDGSAWKALDVQAPSGGGWTEDAGNNWIIPTTVTRKVGIGTASPAEMLELNGAMAFQGIAVPAVADSGKAKLVFDSASKKLKLSEDGSSYTNLIGGAGGAVTLQASTPGAQDTGHLNISGSALFGGKVGVGMGAVGTAKLAALGSVTDAVVIGAAGAHSGDAAFGNSTAILGTGVQASGALGNKTSGVAGRGGGTFNDGTGQYSVGVYGSAGTANDVNDVTAGVYGEGTTGGLGKTYSGYFANGNVYVADSIGIGVMAPSVKLEVIGTAKATAFQGDGSWLTNLNGASLAAGSVDSSKIQNGAVDSWKIAALTIQSGHLAFNAVDSGKLADGAVTAAKIADLAVDSSKLAPGAIDSSKIADGSIGTAKLAPWSVDSGKIANGAVDSWKIAALTIQSVHLAFNAVDTGKLADASVTTAKIADYSVDSWKLAPGSVDSTKIPDGSIIRAKLAPYAVDSSKLADGSVDTAKLANYSVDSWKLADGSVTTPKIAGLAVDSSKLASGAVNSAKLASDFTSLARVTGGLMSIPAADTTKVGIGTTSPGSMLSVAGGADIGGSAAVGGATTAQKLTVYGDVLMKSFPANLFFNQADGSGLRHARVRQIYDTGFYGFTNQLNMDLLDTNDASNAGFHLALDGSSKGFVAMTTENVERMRVDANGRVGIGTSSPGSALDVVGTITGTLMQGPTYSAMPAPANGGGNGVTLTATSAQGTGGQGGDLNLWSGDNTTAVNGTRAGNINLTAGAGATAAGGSIYLKGGDGNVSAQPSGNISLVGGGIYATGTAGNQTTGAINITGGNHTGGGSDAKGGPITLTAGSATGAGTNHTGGSVILDAGNASGAGVNIVGSVLFKIAGAEKMRVDSSGNVGIGTTNPGQALEVNGGVRLNTAMGQPSCTSVTRGTFWFVQSAGGIKDRVEVCAKDAVDAYAWRILY